MPVYVTPDRQTGSVTAERSVTRAELMAEYGLGRSTLEKWFRERAVTGHPEPDGHRGRELTWNVSEWRLWYTSRAEGGPPKAGRTLVSRDDLSRLSGLSKHALKELWADRAANGHPQPVERHGKAMYWDADAWTEWHASLPAEPERELLTLAEAGRLLGLAPSSVTVYATCPPKGWPAPVEEIPLAGGRVRRLYRRSDVLAYAESKN